MPERQVTDLGRERIVRGLELLLKEAEASGLDLLAYLIDLALIEARENAGGTSSKKKPPQSKRD